MKKKTDKDNSKKVAIAELRDEFKRHTTTLMEHMTKEVKTVAEGYGALSSKLNNIDERLSKIESTFFKNEWAIESIKNKAGTIDTKIDRIENAVLDISNAIKDHGNRITKLEEKIAV